MGNAGVLALVAPDLAFLAERRTELPVVRREADLVSAVENQEGERGLLHGSAYTRRFELHPGPRRAEATAAGPGALALLRRVRR